MKGCDASGATIVRCPGPIPIRPFPRHRSSRSRHMLKQSRSAAGLVLRSFIDSARRFSHNGSWYHVHR